MKKVGTTIPAGKVKTNTAPKPSNTRAGTRSGSGGNRSKNGTPGRR